MKKYVHITFSDNSGGAAIAAYRLHRAMLENGLDSKMVVFNKTRSEDNIFSISGNDLEYYFGKFKTYVIADRGYLFDKERGFYSRFTIGSNLKNNNIIHSADVIIIHWICKGILNVHNIVDFLKHGKKVFWVMHDMFPITGGCHHSFSCDSYKSDCLNCPFSGTRNNEAHRQLLKKSKLKQYNNMHWIAPSEWLYDRASCSKAICKDRLFNIPNIISNNFLPIDKTFSRRALRLDKSKKYILYGADGIASNPYKRIDIFFDTIKLLFDKNLTDVEILIFGSGDNTFISEKIPFKTHFMGVINDERTMNLLYNASDVYVSTSMAENYPLTIQEAKYCCLPIVSFDVGGTIDIIGDVSGDKLIPLYDVPALADAIYEVLTSNAEKVSDEQLIEERNVAIRQYLSLLNGE